MCNLIIFARDLRWRALQHGGTATTHRSVLKQRHGKSATNCQNNELKCDCKNWPKTNELNRVVQSSSASYDSYQLNDFPRSKLWSPKSNLFLRFHSIHFVLTSPFLISEIVCVPGLRACNGNKSPAIHSTWFSDSARNSFHVQTNYDFLRSVRCVATGIVVVGVNFACKNAHRIESSCWGRDSRWMIFQMQRNHWICCFSLSLMGKCFKYSFKLLHRDHLSFASVSARTSATVEHAAASRAECTQLDTCAFCAH